VLLFLAKLEKHNETYKTNLDNSSFLTAVCGYGTVGHIF